MSAIRASGLMVWTGAVMTSRARMGTFLRSRPVYQVPLPEESGPDGFNRVFLVHMNTLENVPLFLPLLWLFAAAWGDTWAGIFGGAWVAGRFLYAWGYYRAVSLRLCGFGISSSAALLMLAACLYAVVAAL